MFCTLAYHGDCHAEQAKGVCVCVCMCYVCSCASSSAISQAQSPKLFSKEAKIKGETPTIPSLWFSLPPFPSSHLSQSPSYFLSLLPALHPYLSRLARSPFSCRSIFNPTSLCTSLQMPAIALPHPMATTKRGSEEEKAETDWQETAQKVFWELYCTWW